MSLVADRKVCKIGFVPHLSKVCFLVLSSVYTFNNISVLFSRTDSFHILFTTICSNHCMNFQRPKVQVICMKCASLHNISKISTLFNTVRATCLIFLAPPSSLVILLCEMVNIQRQDGMMKRSKINAYTHPVMHVMPPESNSRSHR